MFMQNANVNVNTSQTTNTMWSLSPKMWYATTGGINLNSIIIFLNLIENGYKVRTFLYIFQRTSQTFVEFVHQLIHNLVRPLTS